jgi:hypothetical protein
MSLLDKANQCVIVYPEEVVTDADGNIRTQPSQVGFPARARIQPQIAAGGFRGAASMGEGFEGTQLYTLRFPRSFKHILGAQSQIEWMGARWVIHGDAAHFHNSRATAHHTYTIKRY